MDAAYAAIRAISSSIVIVGPSTTHWNSWATDYLAHAKSNATLPNHLAFHELGGVSQMVAEIAAAKAFLIANDPGITLIDIPEYVDQGSTYLPGTTVQYMAAIERAQINASAHACWNNSLDCFDNSLSGLIGTDGVTIHAVYYAYTDYGAITGNMAPVTPASGSGVTIDGIAGVD